MTSHPVEVVFFIVTAVVPLALVLATRQPARIRTSGEKKALYLPVILTTASYLYFLFSWAFPSMLGPDYSMSRFTVIGLNCGLMLILFTVSVFRKEPRKLMLAAAALALGLAWLIVGAISSAA